MLAKGVWGGCFWIEAQHVDTQHYAQYGGILGVYNNVKAGEMFSLSDPQHTTLLCISHPPSVFHRYPDFPHHSTFHTFCRC